jgi:hypothetical protein
MSRPNPNYLHMKNILFFLVTTLLIVSCSNPSKDPQTITQNFYTLLKQSEFEAAKELCSPSAIEYVEKLQKLYKNTNDTFLFRIIDIVKKKSPVEGDIAIVSYKIGDFKNQIHLVFTDGQYKVTFTKGLNKLMVLEKSALDLYIEYQGNSYLLWKNYGGTRLKVNEIIGGYGEDSGGRKCILAIPYNSKDNSAPLQKSDKDFSHGYTNFIVYHAGKEVLMSGERKNSNHNHIFELHSENPEFRSMVGEYDNDFNQSENRPTRITYPSSFTFEGVLTGWKNDNIMFKYCKITTNK